MSQKNNDIIYTAADIEKYHRGLLSTKQMHALEKAALDDPFLADALEGYTASGVGTSADITELKNRLAKRIGEENKVIPITSVKKASFSWWKAAAMIVLVAGAGLIVYELGFNSKKSNIAQTIPKEKAEKAEVGDSGKTTSPVFLNADSTTRLVEADQKKEKTRSEISNNLPTETETKTDDLVKKDKEDALSEPTVSAAPSNAPIEKNEEIALNDDKRQKAVTLGYGTKKQNAKSDTIAHAAEQKISNAVPSQRVDDNYKVQQNRLFNQSNVFRGRVTDAHNNALPFSNITNTEDNIGTYSDANGYFILTSPDSVLNVQVSSVGFESNKVQLQNNVPNNNVLLTEDRSSLAEVVITNKKVNSNRSRDANMVLEEPEPADGWNNYDLYLANNLKTPEVFKSKQPDIKGEVELAFEVDKNGTPYNITVKKALCESCDKEAIRLVKEGPKWKRKAKKGKATVKIAF